MSQAEMTTAADLESDLSAELIIKCDNKCASLHDEMLSLMSNELHIPLKIDFND